MVRRAGGKRAGGPGPVLLARPGQTCGWGDSDGGAWARVGWEAGGDREETEAATAEGLAAVWEGLEAAAGFGFGRVTDSDIDTLPVR
jgi:hypothetical protein